MSGIDNSINKKRITIELKEGVSALEIYSFVQALGGQLIRTFKYFQYIVVEVPEDKFQALAVNEAVSDIFEDGEVFALEQQLPWGVDRIDAEKVQSLYGIKGFGIKVAVVDTGIDLNHPDLKVYGGASFISTTFQDDNGHGTHVAGVVAALDNEQGVIGVAPEAQLYALKILDASGSGRWSDLAAAIEWAVDNNMDIITMSLGGGSADKLVQAAVTKAYQNGILLIAAAGNSGNNEGTGDNVMYPAKYPEVIAVAATDSGDKRAFFSSTGPKVEIAAPGVTISSTYLGATYKSMSGTSMATPHVSGLAALVKSTYPSLTNEEIRKKLTETAIDLGVIGRDTWYGYGLLSAPAAVQEPGPDIRPPRIFFKSPGLKETVSGIVKIELLAQDLSGVNNLKLTIDGTLAGAWSSPPYIYFWDTTKVSAGIHDLTVEAVDGAGNAGQAIQQVNVGAAVTLLKPKAGFIVKDDVPIKASLSDNATVSKVHLYVNDIFKETKTPVDHQVDFVWDSREVKLPGTSKHIIQVVAVTDSGLQTSTSVKVVMRNPVVRIVQPETGSRAADDKVTIFAHVTDAEGIEKVEFFVDNFIAETVVSQPYTISLNAADLVVGNHIVRAAAYSKTGHLAESKEVVLKKPTGISFISPLDGDVIKEKHNITVSFADPVSTAEIFIDNNSLGTKSINGMGPVSWAFDITGYQDLSAVSIKVNAYTVKDRVLSSAGVTVTIDNYQTLTSPMVRIVLPQNGYVIDRPQVEIAAEAKDNEGINYVEFYLADKALKKVFNPPYKILYDFMPVVAGKHYLTAKAENALGNTGISDRVEIAKPAFVTIVSPAHKSKVMGTLSEFKITCSDEIVGPIKLYIDRTLCQTIRVAAPTTGPVVIPYSWDTTRYPVFSEHTISVEVLTVKDLILSKGIAVVIVDNTVDNTPPVIKLQSSQTGNFSGTVLFTAQASDDKGVERVEFYINGSLAEDQVFPDEYEWDSSKAPTGNYSFMAKAYDTAGNLGLSNIINLAVPTKVSIISPATDCHIIGAFNEFTASFADPVLGNVNLYIDNEYKATAEITGPVSGPVRINYNWDTSAYPQLSQHEIMITANTAQDQILSTGATKVYVDNRTDITPPAVNLSASAYRAIPGNDVTFSATVTDNIGISHVEFYKDGALVATVADIPYVYVWKTIGQSVGKYSFTAKAYDYAGNATAGNQILIGIAAAGTITDPREGQVVSGVVNKFTAQFNEPVSGYVYLYIDGSLKAGKYIGTSAGPVTVDYSWDTSAYINGSMHEINIKAYTAVGLVRSTGSVNVTVQN